MQAVSGRKRTACPSEEQFDLWAQAMIDRGLVLVEKSRCNDRHKGTKSRRQCDGSKDDRNKREGSGIADRRKGGAKRGKRRTDRDADASQGKGNPGRPMGRSDEPNNSSPPAVRTSVSNRSLSHHSDGRDNGIISHARGGA